LKGDTNMLAVHLFEKQRKKSINIRFAANWATKSNSRFWTAAS